MMKNEKKEFLRQLGNRLVGDRALLLALLMIVPAVLFTCRLTSLQLINGEQYQKSFQSNVTRTIHIPGNRGRILDRNGKVLAENKEVNNIVMVDVTGNSADETARLNTIIRSTISKIESHGDVLTYDFGIAVEGTSYVYTKTESALMRFLADVYGYADPEDLSADEKSKTAEQVVEDLADRYRITSGGSSKSDRKMLLETVIVRYELSLNTYQKYNSTVLAKDVSDDTVRAIEDASDLSGVSIETSYARVYYDSEMFSCITGYTGEINDTELQTLAEDGAVYTSGDYVGKVGIESSQEQILHGESGQRIISVDSMGRELEELSYLEPGMGDDVYLTIDANLQKAAYQIIEQNLTLILLEKMTEDVESFIITEDTDSSDIVIPANEVYAAILNHVIDTSHFDSDDATQTESSVYGAFSMYLDAVKDSLKSELTSVQTPYGDLSGEYQAYENYIVGALYDRGVLVRDHIDTEDAVYVSWVESEDISMTEFLRHAIEEEWISTDMLGLDEGSDYEKTWETLVNYILDNPCEDNSFCKKVYRYMCISGAISGNQVCTLLFDQNIVTASSEDTESIAQGNEHQAYVYVRKLIQNSILTPAQLCLYPYSGSVVITDVNNGDVLALVSYPGYDCNRIDESDYYNMIASMDSKPLLNYATQQRTAPGSTFKMVSATAGLSEDVIALSETIRCTGIFDAIDPSPKCWIYPSSHGSLNVEGAIANSCNNYFYEVGYRLGQDLQGNYESERGTDLLAKYVSLYGLDQKSGVEIEEVEPSVASRDSVRAAIGQSNHSYTTAALARYVTAIATSGNVYDLTLIDHTTSSDGFTETENQAELIGHVTLDEDAWSAIHQGMRRVVQGKSYFSSLSATEDGVTKSVQAAGKTGTAQNASNTPHHALFLGYAPYDTPEIAVATRIPNGYTSDYAAQITQKIMAYYFDPGSLSSILKDNSLAYTSGAD